MSHVILWYIVSQNILKCIQIKLQPEELRFQIGDLGKKKKKITLARMKAAMTQ